MWVKRIAGGETNDESQNVREEMGVTLKIVLETLNTGLKDQFTGLSQLLDQLGFLLDIESLIDLKSQ